MKILIKRDIFVLLTLSSLLLTGCSKASDTAKNDTGTKEALSVIDTEADMTETEENTEETETEEVIEPEIISVTVTATGDCTLGKTQTQSYDGSFWAYYDSYGENYFFDGVRDIFEADDLTLINLECVLTNETERVEKTFNLKGFPEYTGIMTCSSVEACSLGNNHSQDYGYQSLIDTENALDAAGIVYGYNEHVGTYTTDDGIVIGIVSASLLSTSQASVDYMTSGINTLKEQGADLIICCCHWGIEREYYPNDFQQTVGHQLIDAGADLVIGNHPHVLQGIELYNGKVICYSLGNFCFGGNKNPSDKDTMIFQQTFTFTDGVLTEDASVDARIIPCSLSSVSGYNDFQPTVAEGEKMQSIITNVNAYSSPYSSIYFDSEGVLNTAEESDN